MAWIDALTNMHGLNDEDADRVTLAFRAMAANIEQWPAPATLLKFLSEKPRPYFHALPKPELTAEEEAADKAWRRAITSAAAAELQERMRHAEEDPYLKGISERNNEP